MLIAVAHCLTERFRLPLVISELGASAGLNLLFDHFALDDQRHTFRPRRCGADRLQPDWEGPLPPQATPQVVAREGVDLRPLDPGQAGVARALLYLGRPARPAGAHPRRPWIWPHGTQPKVTRRRCGGLAGNTLAQTRCPAACASSGTRSSGNICRDEARARATAILEAAGAQATCRRALGPFRDGERNGRSNAAALTLKLWPSGEVIDLGRAIFTGVGLSWNGA